MRRFVVPLDRRGTTTVEFAVVGATFIMLSLLLVEVCWQMTVSIALNYGARTASRFAATGAAVPPGMSPAPASRMDAIQRLIVGSTGGVLRSANLTQGEAAYPSFAAVGNANAATAGTGGPGQVVQYSFVYTQPYLTSVPSLITGGPAVAHHVTVVVLNEPYAAQ